MKGYKVNNARIESIKSRLQKSSASEDACPIKPTKWKDYYGEDIGFLLQEIEKIYELVPPPQDDEE